MQKEAAGFEARDGGSGHTSDQAGQEYKAAAGAVLASLPEPPCQTASYSPLPPGLASRVGTRRHDPHRAAPPAKSGHGACRDRPQGSRALKNQPEELGRRALWEL